MGLYPKMKTAQEYWSDPPVKITERLASRRDQPNRKTGHADYMDFAEIYADYVCDYEKESDRGGGTRKSIEQYEAMTPEQRVEVWDKNAD